MIIVNRCCATQTAYVYSRLDIIGFTNINMTFISTKYEHNRSESNDYLGL